MSSLTTIMAVAPACLRTYLVFFFVFYIFSIVFSTSHSLSKAEALLNFKKSLTNTEALSNWVPNSSPRNELEPWEGVLFYRGILNGHRLDQMGLSGKIDIDALLELKDL